MSCLSPRWAFCYRMLLVLFSKVRHPIIIYGSSVISKWSTVVQRLSPDLEWEELKFLSRLLVWWWPHWIPYRRELAYTQGVCLYSTFYSIYSIYTRRSIAFKKLFAVCCPHCMGYRTRRQTHHCFAGNNTAFVFILHRDCSWNLHVMTKASCKFFICEHHILETSVI